MVNYRRVLCEVALLSVFVAIAFSAPTPDCGHNHYDQRQNGSENYRLNIDGIVFAVAPAETVLSALPDLEELMEILDLEDYSSSSKPKPPSSTTTLSSISSVSAMDGEKPKPQEKPTEQEKPQEVQSQEAKPEDTKPEVTVKPAELPPLSDVSLNDDLKVQRKEVMTKKQEKAQRLKNRLASFLLPLLRKTRHQ